ncbi:MAG TPA: hypothetical protein VFE05_01040 [Longimicrobiaceae bacterium]|jgi:photosystem II stability/assembly factor-like uncharacterized protein|nr:hypothetical protein [Longimicrobiaceae bacterium]
MTSRFTAALLALAAAPALHAQEPERPANARPTAAQANQSAMATPFDSTLLAPALKARSIGPAIMGGRVSSIAIDPRNPFTFYVGLGTGGVMKTSDNGGTFQAVFEHERVAAVGAVAVAPSDPQVVWVGTGEANDRNSSAWGDGVYRSTDAGGTWTNVGLHDSRTIARIAVHPADPRTAYVAAMGDLWVPTAERGCYKTTDAGATWRRILSAPAPYAERVGCGDIAVDPSNPNTVYAALYARRRTPWSFQAGPDYTDGRDAGGIFKSTDGGATWKKLSNGLPPGTGRIGLAVFRRDPHIVYAVVQSDAGGTSSIDDVRSKRGGVFRSTDAGETWTRQSPLDPRPFYFSQIRVDPDSSNKVYVLGFALHVSTDGGRTFREDRFKNVHSDLHDLAIDPRDTKRLLLGTDGGAYQSYDGGSGWQHMSRMAAGEFYRINVDMRTPYRICGGLQDNQNWVGPSRTNSKEGITNADWTAVQGGDGFYCFFDQTDPDLVFAESQQAYLARLDLRTGAYKEFHPEPAEGQPAFRFQWDAPMIPSAHDPHAFYVAGNRVFRFTDRGETWRAISPDLSMNDPAKTTTTGSGAEAYGVVYALAESPVKAGVLWAGTDDGKLWTTEDDGAHWTDVSRNVPAPARGEWVSRVEPGHRDARVAYLAVDAHRSGSFAPLAYRTDDGGRTWRSIAGDLPRNGPVKVIREDLKNPNLLYAGTEFGLFASSDGGRTWAKIGGLPTVAVDDILIHPRDLDLIAATHGRSLYVIDDVRPIQELTPAVRAMDAHLFPIRAVTIREPLAGWVESSGSANFRGANPPAGALISYYVRRYTGDEVTLAVTDASGAAIANITAPGTPGLNRVTWDLKPSAEVLTEYGGEGRKYVPAGDYTVTLTYGKVHETQKVHVEVAPNIETR